MIDQRKYREILPKLFATTSDVSKTDECPTYGTYGFKSTWLKRPPCHSIRTATWVWYGILHSKNHHDLPIRFEHVRSKAAPYPFKFHWSSAFFPLYYWDIYFTPHVIIYWGISALYRIVITLPHTILEVPSGSLK